MKEKATKSYSSNFKYHFQLFKALSRNLRILQREKISKNEEKKQKVSSVAKEEMSSQTLSTIQGSSPMIWITLVLEYLGRHFNKLLFMNNNTNMAKLQSNWELEQKLEDTSNGEGSLPDLMICKALQNRSEQKSMLRLFGNWWGSKKTGYKLS